MITSRLFVLGGLLVAAAVSLTGCGTTAALEKVQGLEKDGRYADIKAQVVPDACDKAGPDDAKACSRIFAIRAHACLELVRAETSEGAACPPTALEKTSGHLMCAVAGYEHATTLDPQLSANEVLTENQARSLYCASRLNSWPKRQEMATQAVSKLAGLGADPKRALLAGSAALSIAQDDQASAADRCAAANKAIQLTSASGVVSSDASSPVYKALISTHNVARQVAR